MITKRVDSTTLQRIDTATGETKIIKLASDKQLIYIRALEKELGYKPKAYKNLTVWKAVKVIERLKMKQGKQARLL